MSRFIPLIGGPKNGETIELPDEVNFNLVRFPTHPIDEDQVVYTICQSGDGYFYGVFNPTENDSSIARINALRNTILGAMGGQT